MGCILSTVRNTGSHFALGILERHFERHYLLEDLTGDPVWFSHTETEHLHLIRKHATQYPLILTMRHPIEVAKSWIKRGRKLDKWHQDMWRNLFNLKSDFPDSFWLPVDTGDREDRLRIISERLGVELQTDWEPVSSTQMNKGVDGGMTLDEATDFYRTLPFEPFGYQI